MLSLKFLFYFSSLMPRDLKIYNGILNTQFKYLNSNTV
jgi:hypothetical protein